MGDLILPRYPVYILSKNRYQFERALTARALAKDGVPFILAVETHQVDEYRALCRRLEVPEDYVHDIEFDNLGMGCSSVRNWITDHARANGHARQWQLDDNSRGFYRMFRGKRISCRAGMALRVCEDFTDRYENVALSGLNYDMFAPSSVTKPFVTNCHVYSCTLVNTAITCRWRGPYNEDTDMCLQVLSEGWCTILLNAFLVKKVAAFNGRTGKRTVQGGMSSLYEADGRLRMARSLERWWPHIVTTQRRFQRPQHVVAHEWKRFDTPLRLKPDVDLAALAPVDEYGMRLEQVAEEIESDRIRGLYDAHRETYG